MTHYNCESNNKIFKKQDCVITTFIVPWILGKNRKMNATHAESKIKRGETLNPLYYPANEKEVELNGTQYVLDKFLKMLFNKNNIITKFDHFITETVYEPWDCLSGIFSIQINKKLGLVARVNGVTNNCETIIMNDNYCHTLYDSFKEEAKIKLLASMAVYKAKHGYYYFELLNEYIYLDFDEYLWNNIKTKLKQWADELENAGKI